MLRLAWFSPRLTIFLLGVFLFQTHIFSAAGIKNPGPRSLAILDPIDLQLQRIAPDWGSFLRTNFHKNPEWNVISRDTMDSRFRDYKLDTRLSCHEFQCAFDAGNILGAEYVLFGSITALNEFYSFTFNLVHVPSAQVVWSKVGDVTKKQHGQPEAALEATLVQMAAFLVPDQVTTAKREKQGLLSVLDFSAATSTPSRVLAERVATHLYASRNYDIMGKKEMEELLSALGITKATFNPTDSSIFWLGSKMDITHLVYSRLLEVKTGAYQLQLALYDIAAQKKVREWPAKSTEDFGKLLSFEDKFFASLFKGTAGDEPDAGNSSPPRYWNLAGTGLALAMGAVFGYMSYTAYLDADADYRQFQDARSRESAERLQSSVKGKERNSLVFGVISGVSMTAAGAFLVFSF